MWKTGTRNEKELSCTTQSPSLGPVFRWPSKTYDLVRMRRTSDRQMKKVLSLANSKETCSNPNMKSFPCLTSDFFYQNKICPKFSEFCFSEIQSSLMVLAPNKTDFWCFVGCLRKGKFCKTWSRTLRVMWSWLEICASVRHGDALKITLFFSMGDTSTPFMVGNFQPLVLRFFTRNFMGFH